MYENILGYIVERKKVKNINLRINKDGEVYISAPLNIDESFVRNFIISKKDWIDKHINRINNIKKLNENIETFTNNSYIQLLGKLYLINISLSNKESIIFEDNIIKLNVLDDTPLYISKFIDINIYLPQARKIFKKKFEYYLNLMGHSNDNISLNIKRMKGKWGVCFYRKKLITLNLDLIKRDDIEIDSTIVHEIAHLKYFNHNQDFYNHVNKYLQNYKKKF